MKQGFKDKVIRVVAKIPKGKTLSYKQVAILAGSPRAYRAVGNIMATHGIKGLPCHRVIKSNGTLGGYSGTGGSPTKKRLLIKEKAAFKNK